MAATVKINGKTYRFEKGNDLQITVDGSVYVDGKKVDLEKHCEKPTPTFLQRIMKKLKGQA